MMKPTSEMTQRKRERTSFAFYFKNKKTKQKQNQFDGLKMESRLINIPYRRQVPVLLNFPGKSRVRRRVEHRWIEGVARRSVIRQMTFGNTSIC
jgi:hypothetical protein